MIKNVDELCVAEVIKSYRVTTLNVHLRPDQGFYQSYWDIEITGLSENIILRKVTLPRGAVLCGRCLRLKVEQHKGGRTHPCDRSTTS